MHTLFSGRLSRHTSSIYLLFESGRTWPQISRTHIDNGCICCQIYPITLLAHGAVHITALLPLIAGACKSKYHVTYLFTTGSFAVRYSYHISCASSFKHHRTQQLRMGAFAVRYIYQISCASSFKHHVTQQSDICIYSGAKHDYITMISCGDLEPNTIIIYVFNVGAFLAIYLLNTLIHGVPVWLWL